MEHKKTFALVLILVALSSFNMYQLVLRKSPVLSASAVQVGANIGIYWDNGCTQTVSSIDWGTLTPGQTRDTVVYVRNEGNDTTILDLTTGNWQPGNACLWLNFSWSCPNTASIGPGQVVKVTQTLRVASDVPSGLSNFSFNIVAHALAEYQSIVVRGMDDRIYYRAWNGTGWEDWNVLPGSTMDSLAAAMLGNELHIVVRGSDGCSLWHGYVNLSDYVFSGWTVLSVATPSAPTLTSNGTTLCLVVRGLDNRVYYCCCSEGVWGRRYAVPTGATCDSPAAAMLGNNLHIVVRGMDGSSLWDTIVSCDGTVVRGWSLLSGATPSKPVLACSGADSLCLVVRGIDNTIHYRNYNGSTDSWAGWSALPTGATNDGPAATVVGNMLCTVVRGSDGNSLWCGDTDLGTSSFLGWTLLSGATPSAPTLTS